MAKAKCTDGRRNNKPPLSGQFKPGVCPNPGGRGRGVRNRKTQILDVFEAKATVIRNGKRFRISKYESGLTHLANNFAHGDPKAIAAAHALFRQYGLFEAEATAFLGQLSERDEPVLEDIVR